MQLLILFGLCLVAIPFGALTDEITLVDEWKNLQFSFDSPEQRQEAIDRGLFDPVTQIRPYDSDVYILPNGEWQRFLSMPRVTAKIPYSLAVVDDVASQGQPQPLLKAYPSIDWHLNRTCDGLLSVFRIQIEQSCNRLWVIDSGRDFTHSGITQVCPPKIVAFNLLTNEVEVTYELPADQYIPEKSVFNSIILYPNEKCSESLAYVTDTRGFGLIVFSRTENGLTSWRTESDHYKADVRYYPTTILNETFTLPDGLYTVAPSVRTETLYLHSFTSYSEVSVPLAIINNPEFWNPNEPVPTEAFFEVAGERPTQSSVEAIDSLGNIWFTIFDPLALLCWNPEYEYNVENFKTAVIDEENLQFVAGLKVRHDPILGEIIWGVSNRLQKHNTGTLNPEEINYRIFYLPISDIDCNPPQ